MKRKIFFRQSGLYWFDVFIIFIMLSWCGFGVVYIFIENEKALINYIAIIGGIAGFLLFGFELLRMVRQVIILKDNEIYVPEEWGMSDEKFQHKVSVLYTEIDYVFLRETTCDSNNKPVQRYWLTLPNLYFVMHCKNGKEKSINILFYSKKCRIKIIDEIIDRMKLQGNKSCNKTGKEIYEDFLEKSRTKKKIKYFYNLKFFKTDNEAFFDLGVFSCLKNAEKKQKQAETKCGFIDNPENFRIIKIGVKFKDDEVVEKSKTALYCVWLEYSQSENEKIVDCFKNFGYYSTKEEALKVADYNKKHSRIGKKHPEGFLVNKVLVDDYSEWSEGFVS